MLTKLNIANSVEDLSDIIAQNSEELFDYFGLINHADLLKKREDFKKLSLKTALIESLDYSKHENVAFINLILNASIRLGDMFVFARFYSILKDKNLEISNLISASSLYMIGVKSSNDLHERYDEIVSRLEEAYLTETDSEEDSIASLVNYYAIFVKNFGEFAALEVEKLKNKILETYGQKVISFIQNKIINAICSVDLSFESSPFENIHLLLDEFLGRNRAVKRLGKGFIIEDETEYSKLINSNYPTFNAIIELNKTNYNKVRSDAIFYSLQRGVKQLETEEQLFAYIFSYGRMHYAKLNSAITNLPDNINNHNVVDWGCGQGLASIAFLEYLKEKSILNLCKDVILIEPSLLALKRASLHVHIHTKRIITINKDLDSVDKIDFPAPGLNSTVHLLSNILDIEMFSLSQLTETIKSTFKGINYFVITSPYVNETKTARIDSFVNQFNIEEVFVDVDNRKGTWTNDWSRVVRVFKAAI